MGIALQGIWGFRQRLGEALEGERPHECDRDTTHRLSKWHGAARCLNMINPIVQQFQFDPTAGVLVIGRKCEILYSVVVNPEAVSRHNN